MTPCQGYDPLSRSSFLHDPLLRNCQLLCSPYRSSPYLPFLTTLSLGMVRSRFSFQTTTLSLGMVKSRFSFQTTTLSLGLVKSRSSFPHDPLLENGQVQVMTLSLGMVKSNLSYWDPLHENGHWFLCLLLTIG